MKIARDRQTNPDEIERRRKHEKGDVDQTKATAIDINCKRSKAYVECHIPIVESQNIQGWRVRSPTSHFILNLATLQSHHQWRVCEDDIRVTKGNCIERVRTYLILKCDLADGLPAAVGPDGGSA
jgi:hypothetical protein